MMGMAVLFLLLAVVYSLQCEDATGSMVLLDASQINDDYCDCTLTGEDETTTSACSSLSTFKCSDETVITGTRVQDGVCDCCDGGVSEI